jgi:hypothetical protein
MANAIIESGMPFIADNTFRIEESAAYRALGDGIKSVEFVRRKDEALMFIEAKTTKSQRYLKKLTSKGERYGKSSEGIPFRVCRRSIASKINARKNCVD